MKRVWLGVAAVVLVGASLAAGLLLDDDDMAARMDRGPSVVAFSEPPRLTSAGGMLAAGLSAESGPIIAGGRQVIGRAYNREFVGPTLVVQPGDTLKVHFDNELIQPSNLHFHGLHVSPLAPSDQVVHLQIPPGQQYDYVVHIPRNHDRGTFWYHSHSHGTSEDQVFGGLSGALIVGEPPIPGARRLTDRLFALKDFQVSRGQIPDHNINSNAPTTRTVNGLVDPHVSGRPGDVELWRLANVGADIWYKVALEGHTFHVVTEDGNPPHKIWEADSLLLPPGKRYDVLVQYGKAGSYLLETLRYNQENDLYPRAKLATVDVAGKPVTGKRLPQRPTVAPPRLPKATAKRTKILTENEAASAYMINGKKFDPMRVDDRVKLGTVEDWTFVNKTTEQHPIHVHQEDFWVVAKDGKPTHPRGRQDTVIVRPRHRVTIRVPFADFTGPFVYHCHILNHEQNGMMAVVDVTR
jgi:FtsP/CotA-like multicopper oxidase with cupredoxin domain